MIASCVFARFDRRELRERVEGCRMQKGYPDPSRHEQRTENSHCPPTVGDKIPPQSRTGRDDEACQKEGYGERRSYRSKNDPARKQERPEIQAYRRGEVELQAAPTGPAGLLKLLQRASSFEASSGRCQELLLIRSPT